MSGDAPAEGGRISGPETFARRFAVSRETIDKLETYADVLKFWQRSINLVAPVTVDDVWHRHFADSAQLWPLVPAAARTVLDLGSGAGFPGLVLAILDSGVATGEAGTGRTYILAESDTRKAAFLAEVARKTGTAVDIRPRRIEFLSTQDKVGAVDVVTARALAPLVRLCGLMKPHFGASTMALLLKGREAAAEIAAARTEWAFEADLASSRTDAAASVVTMRNLRANTEG